MFVLNQQPSLASQFLAELRDVNIQHDRLRFRRNLERLGEIMAYEISRDLRFTSSTIDTPLKATQVDVIAKQPVIISVLRAAVPFFQGFINYFDQADCGFIGAFRNEADEHKAGIDINLGYVVAPDIEGKEIILVDPMLATGKSLVEGLKRLLSTGLPSRIHIAAVIAAPEGIAYIRDYLKVPYKIWTCALDERLDTRFFIVPGLGDAGDLAYGPKQ